MAKRSRKKARGSSRPTSEVILPPTVFSQHQVLGGWMPLLMAVIAFTAYIPSLGSGFVYDARIEILEEGYITSISHLADVLLLKVLGMKLMLAPRPGQMLYLMLIAVFAGKAPFLYHLGSNLLHAANTALLYIVMLRLVDAEWPELPASAARQVQWAAAAFALVFSLHPIGVESVAEISYSSSLLVTCFTLVALLAAMAFRPDLPRRALWTGAAGIFCAVFAIMCKESGIAVVPLLVVYWLLYRRSEKIGPWLIFFATASALSAAYVAARLLCALPAPHYLGYLGGSPAMAAWLQPRLWVYMMEKLVWPVGFSADYTPENISGLSSWTAIEILLLVLAGQAWLGRKSRLGLFGIAVYWFGLATVSNIFPLYRPIADRFYYLPLTGAAMQLLALFTLSLTWRPGAWKAWAPFALALVPLAWLTLLREPVFADESALWTDTIRVSPTSSIAYNDLGMVLFRKGDVEGAAQLYEKAVAIAPQFGEAHRNYGNALLDKGQIDEAITEYEKALKIDNSFADVHNNLGNALIQKGLIHEAITQYRLAVQFDSHVAGGHYNLASALTKIGEVDEAEAELRVTLQLDPTMAGAYNDLGKLEMQAANFDEAEPLFQKAVALDPTLVDARCNLGSILFRQGNTPGAIDQYRQAIKSNPTFARAHENLGQLLLNSGQWDEASAELKEGLRLDPTDSVTQKALAQAEAEKAKHP